MKITTNAQGKDRKRLAQVIGKWLELPVRYAGAPTFNYEVGGIIIDKDASLEFGTALTDEAADRLLQHLCDEGFDIFQFFGSEDSLDEDGENAFTISLPRDLFTEGAIDNLHDLLDSKKSLICKALGINDTPVVVTDEKVSFPWFDEVLTPEDLDAYETFICRLCEMSRNQKRITAKEKDVDNEKYAFRCFLLRLGFIGADQKQNRKILLRNLSGSTAFKSAPAVKEEEA